MSNDATKKRKTQPNTARRWISAGLIASCMPVGSAFAQELLPPVPPMIDMTPPPSMSEWLEQPVVEVDTLDLMRQMDEFRSTMDNHRTDLNEQFDRLEELLDRACEPTQETSEPAAAPASNAAAVATTPEEATAPPPPDDEGMVQPPSATASNGSGAPSAPAGNAPPPPSIAVEPLTTKESNTDTSSIWEDDAILNTITVTENAINRLALANNLYAAGEVKIALKIYGQLRLEANEADQEWVIYQIAQCHRRLGNKSEADQAFRIVTAMPSGGRWSANARWWLHNGDGLATIDSKSAQLADAVDRLKSAVQDAQTQ